jgi:hypothetical protein
MRDSHLATSRALGNRRGPPILIHRIGVSPKLPTAAFCTFAIIQLLAPIATLYSQDQKLVYANASSTGLVQLINQVHGKAKTLESSNGMRLGFQSFISAHKLTPESIHFSDYVIVRLLFEATRDAGFWNLHWSITDQPPNSDNIWRQWRSVKSSSAVTSTATAECDELSALYAFLVERAGVKGVGLFWPAPNHTVAVWVVRPVIGPAIRVVVPTSQIFLDETDFFDTKKFNPWSQKNIYEYTRRDVPDSFELPKPLFDFFVQQMDKYGGATDATLQQLRYLREAVFLRNLTPEQASRSALKKRANLVSGPPEDLAALQNFAQDLRSEPHR